MEEKFKSRIHHFSSWWLTQHTFSCFISRTPFFDPIKNYLCEEKNFSDFLKRIHSISLINVFQKFENIFEINRKILTRGFKSNATGGGILNFICSVTRVVVSGYLHESLFTSPQTTGRKKSQIYYFYHIQHLKYELHSASSFHKLTISLKYFFVDDIFVYLISNQ